MIDKPQELLKRIVIAFDADQYEELIEAFAEARELLGLKLHDDADEVIDASRKEAESEVVRCCVHGKFSMRAPCQECNPFRRGVR